MILNKELFVLKKINHIGIAVKSIENAIKFYEVIGIRPYHFEEVEAQKVKTAFIKIGDTNIELLEATSNESPISNLFQKR